MQCTGKHGLGAGFPFLFSHPPPITQGMRLFGAPASFCLELEEGGHLL